MQGWLNICKLVNEHIEKFKNYDFNRCRKSFWKYSTSIYWLKTMSTKGGKGGSCTNIIKGTYDKQTNLTYSKVKSWKKIY